VSRAWFFSFYIFVFNRIRKEKTALGTKNQRRAPKYRWRRYCAHFIVRAQFTRDCQETGLDSLSMRKKLCANSGVCSICPNQKVAGCARTILESNDNSAVRRIFKSDEFFAEVDYIVEAIKKNTSQCDTGYRVFRIQ